MLEHQIAARKMFIKREVTYTLMRVLRAVGWTLWPVGMLLWMFGLSDVLMYFIDPTPSGMEPLITGPLMFVVGVATVILSLSITIPYQFESRSSEAKMAKCQSCGGDLVNPETMFPLCEKCDTRDTLGLTVVVARFIGSQITAINIIIILTGFGIAIL